MIRLRVLLLVGIILVLATSIFTYVFLDNDFFIRKWRVPMAPQGFHDSRQFAWASEAFAQGYDPLIENPVNPRGHQLNYPRIWHLLFDLGINESHTNLLGTIVVIFFFVGISIFWFSRKFDNLTYVILSVIILSPSVMLGIERSNIELILFFIISLALTINYYSSISALFVFVFAAILKIYPIFGFLYLLQESRRRFWVLFLSASAIFILYALLSFNDFLQVYKTTPQLVGSSFGINVWWRGLGHSRFLNLPISENLALILKVFSYIVTFLILATTLYFSMRRKDVGLYSQGQYLDTFRVGAGIFIGCFLLMNTHDYRLIFLVFTIPQIVEWIRAKEKRISLVPQITLAAMVFSVWSFFIMRVLGRKVTFLMEEFSNWLILAGLLYLFFSSLPDWFLNDLRRPLSRGKLFKA
jgi:hypothetical protein